MKSSSILRGAAAAAAIVCIAGGSFAWAQGAPAGGSGYRDPPAPIAQILDAAPTPAVALSPDRRTLALLGRENLPKIAAVAEPILKLAGYRLNPRTRGPVEQRANWLNALSFQDLAGGEARPVALPAGARFMSPSWSPDGRSMAFLVEAEGGLELWVADVASARARRLTDARVSAAWGGAYSWLPDSSAVLARLTPEVQGAAPEAPRAPGGPLVQENKGRATPGRTYQDLLSNPADEALFDHYFTVQLARVSLKDGAIQPLGQPGLYAGAAVSPDGRYILTTRLKRPYSYIVPASRFPTEVNVVDWSGGVIKQVVDRPLADDIPPPFDAVVTGPRSFSWRDDAPATLVWAEAQDGGDPRKKVAVHDRVYMQAAPFKAAPTTLVDLEQRYGGVQWGRSNFAIVNSAWWDTRNEKRIAVDPSRPGEGRVLIERNYQDQYGDPGDVVMRPTPNGRALIHFTPDGKGVFMTGQGARREGDFPFLSRMAIADASMKKLWEAGASHYEPIVALADDKGARLITQRQSRTDAPNYFLRTVGAGEPVALTRFEDKAPQFAGVTKQLITYKRADGLPLSGTLYLPAGYDAR
ncbi:MAG TPA: S9 family peptidase, partial [Caulobacteraceae bacterium]|nr:S9 family peptidase [Caulobacteraceae bacterium]